ncbi:MAG TPA: AAC(3) family N-acetyltransferase [Pyrinomonadaceae bacterium]|nr:AAC(3) family N-acetyltransferase [Pyrinomonadaceae bacterium]
MSVSSIARRILPAELIASLTRTKKRLNRARVSRLPLLSEKAFTNILRDELLLTSGDTVYVHSSVDQLNLEFPFYRVLPLIQNVIGPQGTVLFPTYPNRSPISSYEYLLSGKVFDVRRTPSYTGLLTEFARRQRNAVRSLHPTKSVCAIGRHAKDLTATHQQSPYPYDRCSPYFKLVEHQAKIVGIGVWTTYLSFVYCVDDALKKDGPVDTYFPELFAAQCINYEGNVEIVETYAHDMTRVIHDIPQFMKEHVPEEICLDIAINGMKFFRANAQPLFELMLGLAKEGITVYPRSVYSPRFLHDNK